MLLSLPVVVALAVLTSAVPTGLKHAVHEKRDTPAMDWVRGSRIETNAVLPMRIGLTQTNLELGYDYVMEV
jgi:tripeptidyl-peptidase-1